MISLSIVAIIVAAAALWAELARNLMMLQQNSYRNERFNNWYWQAGESTTVMRLVSLAVFFASLSTLSTIPVACGLIIAVSLINFIILLRRKYKKPLVWTSRARRIFIFSWLLAAACTTPFLIVMGCGIVGLERGALVILLLFIVSNWVLMASNWLLKPVEKSINMHYRHDAENILAEMPGLKIIGITGSYGKTSTKHFLYRILSEKFDVAMTPGSFNTTLGVIRTIREHLKPYNEVFIVEMGAKNPGDIKEICDLVHPQAGIITAVGEQHLESFKTIERVRDTKFELADALPEDGLIVVNNDFPYAESRVVSNVECVRYAITNPDEADYWATDIVYGPDGTNFKINSDQDAVMEFHTRLVGEGNVSDLIAAIILSLSLGVEAEKVKYAVSRIQPVEHRLSMKRTSGDITILDDAFNSNPVGSAMALKVLKSMTGGKRIIITPGMIELGARQYDANREFGRGIAESADVAVIVGKYNREAIVSGIEEAGTGLKPIIADTFKEAQARLHTLVKPGDTVLYENDLPDTFK